MEGSVCLWNCNVSTWWLWPVHVEWVAKKWSHSVKGKSPWEKSLTIGFHPVSDERQLKDFKQRFLIRESQRVQLAKQSMKKSNILSTAACPTTNDHGAWVSSLNEPQRWSLRAQRPSVSLRRLFLCLPLEQCRLYNGWRYRNPAFCNRSTVIHTGRKSAEEGKTETDKVLCKPWLFLMPQFPTSSI